MVFTLSAALIFLALTVIGIRYANLPLGWALVAFLAGFFIAGTGAAPAITNLVTTLAHAAGHH
jgi:hypothetical protein